MLKDITAFLLLILLFIAFPTIYMLDTIQERENEGRAKSEMIMELQGIKIPAKYARFATIMITTTDVQLSIAQFTVIGAN